MVKPGRRYELGEDARTHLLEHLGTWGVLEWKPLGGRGIDPATGQVYAFLPSGLAAEELTIEALNRITYERSYATRSGPAALLRAHLQTENAVYVVPEVCPSFQEMLTWPKDWLPPLAVGCDDRAFQVWTSAVDDLGRLEDALGATFVDPVLVCEVQALGLTPQGRLRQPAYRGRRPDLLADDVTLEDVPGV